MMCHQMINERHGLELDLTKNWDIIVEQVVDQKKTSINWIGKPGWRKSLNQAITHTLDQKWRAVKAIIKSEQQKYYGEEMIKAFRHGGWVGTKLKNVAASFDTEGLLRAHARLDLSVGFHVQETRPILLPRKSEATKRLVQWTHVKLGHWTSAAVVTTVLRRRFWILSMYEYVRGIIRHCFECQCLNNKPGRQKMGDLPKQVVSYDKLEPFRHVAMDFAGPFKVRLNKILCKNYLLVIVCRQL
jgi:hypothetical protein